MPVGAYGGGSGCEEVVINGQNCVHCPAVEAVEGEPARVDVERLLGWNASAYSVLSLDYDCYTQFDIPGALGAVVGFVNERISNDPRDIPHGFYIYRSTGSEWYTVVEHGVAKTAPVVHNAADVFRIERYEHVVTYIVNSARVWTSAVLSYNALRVVACLYDSGDTVG